MPWDYGTDIHTIPSKYMKTFSNQYHQIQCHGCVALRSLFSDLRRKLNGQSSPVQIHENYRELSLCAERCTACQIFQRALLLQQITVQDSLDLDSNDAPVYARLLKREVDLVLEISLGMIGVSPSKIATIQCTSEDESTHLSGISSGANWAQLRTWLSVCDDNHNCRNHRWSNANPTWLIKILPENRIQLVKGIDAGDEKGNLAQYVALSYCWGNPASVTAKDPKGWQRVLRANTQSQEPGVPVAERLRPFSRMEFPETLRDAIKICEELGQEYIWIDQVCIIDHWDDEAGKMHEVYGNAYFTLFAASADKAIDPLCSYRRAWHHPVRKCRLFGYWLSIRDLSLAEMRLRNPLSRRGWILQEERLSPRILFWTAQRAYWSCCEGTALESKQSKATSSPISSNAQSRPQDFMLLTRSGDNDQMQEEWLELVSSYTRRSLSNPGKEKDRFRAISGLAVRYLSSGNSNAPQRNEYLAGLWRHNFARHLAWRVITAVPPENNLRSVAPTWSWASLPLSTEVDLRSTFEESEYFTLLEPSRTQPGDSERDIVERGALTRSVRVRGRFRRLIPPDSILVPWEAVVPVEEDGEQNFNMPLDPSFSIHARSMGGRLLSYEAHKEPVVCQLDYLAPEAAEAEKGKIHHVELNSEVNLFCMELGRASMLLLEEFTSEQTSDRFRRVGVGLKHRQNFFEGYEVKEVVLE